MQRCFQDLKVASFIDYLPQFGFSINVLHAIEALALLVKASLSNIELFLQLWRL